MIEAKKLTMHYGSVVALADASFEVPRGQVVGLLGPNGAGKSTTMKILTTYICPTSGTASIGGKDIQDDPIAARRLTGYLPEVLPLYMNMEVAEYLSFVGQARGLRGKPLKDRIAFVVEKCHLKTMYRRPIQELSKGYKQRTGLAQALIHDPQVLILDEPTSGLDPRQIQDIRALVNELAQEKTIILSTHILQEAEAMADRIIIINHGNLVAQGTIDELRSQAHETNRALFAAEGAGKDAEKVLGEIKGVSGCRIIDNDNGLIRFELVGKDEGAMITGLGSLAKEKGWRVAELTASPYTLEETFLALTQTENQVKGGAA